MSRQPLPLDSRTVKPRVRRPQRIRPVIAVVGEHVLTESGEAMLLDELIPTIPDLPTTLFVAINGADLLSHLSNIFKPWFGDAWQFRVMPHEREAYTGDSSPVRLYHVTTVVHWFGFKRNPPLYHRLIDPLTMYGRPFQEILPGREGLLVRILNWAIALRDFCAVNNLDVRPTLGGMSAQLLRDSRFYPEPRRKIPARINEIAREHLPGNYYTLEVYPSPEREYRALYIDQHRAHHYHAQTIAFPSANDLYACGYYQNLEACYREQPSPDFMGLYCLDLIAPHFGKHYSWIKGNGQLERQFVYTNELSHLADMGYRVTGVRAAWGSIERDTGLPKLAAWACEQLDEYDDVPWLKPLLLAAYGVLACRSTHAETIFHLAKSGEPITVKTGKRSLSGTLVKRKRKLEPQVVNVIQRGMIEAATRSESIGLEQHLVTRGQRILQTYADAVIIELNDDLPLEPLPEPWRVKRELNHYQPINQQAFISDGMSRLPGVGKELNKYRQATRPGYAPRRTAVEALTGRIIHTDRRI